MVPLTHSAKDSVSLVRLPDRYAALNFARQDCAPVITRAHVAVPDATRTGIASAGAATLGGCLRVTWSGGSPGSSTWRLLAGC